LLGFVGFVGFVGFEPVIEFVGQPAAASTFPSSGFGTVVVADLPDD